MRLDGKERDDARLLALVEASEPSCDGETATAGSVGGDATRHLDLHTRDTAPWDAAALPDGAVVVERTDLAVLDGQREGDPGGGEGGDAGVDTRALVQVEAEHLDGVLMIVKQVTFRRASVVG